MAGWTLVTSSPHLTKYEIVNKAGILAMLQHLLKLTGGGGEGSHEGGGGL